MEIIVRKRDIYICLAAVGAFIGLFAYHHYDQRKIDAELHAFARAQAILQVGSEEELERNWDFLSIAHSEKSFYIAGPAFGAIHSFLREKGDESMKTFKGYEYFMKRVDGAWELSDSAGCGALEHHVDGFEAFERRGFKVAQGAYDKALGFGDAPARKHEHAHDHEHDHHHDHGHGKEAKVHTVPERAAL